MHTHGHYVVDKNDQFSQADINIAHSDPYENSVYAYVGIPKGEVLKYDPWSSATVSIFDNAPFDANHPRWRVE